MLENRSSLLPGFPTSCQDGVPCFGSSRYTPLEMDFVKMIEELRQERDQLEEAILTLERLATGRGKRRGRPPAWMATGKKRRGRPPGSKNKVKAA
jgi:hypothetical protein